MGEVFTARTHTSGFEQTMEHPEPKQERSNKLMGRVKLDHLDEENKKTIFPMIKEFKDVATHEIETTLNIPINKRQYRFPEATKKHINEQIDEML